MELQKVLVRSRIDELQRTARELRAVDTDIQPRIGLRRRLGERLIVLGTALVGGSAPSRHTASAQMS